MEFFARVVQCCMSLQNVGLDNFVWTILLLQYKVEMGRLGYMPASYFFVFIRLFRRNCVILYVNDILMYPAL